jgi:hypothetical protein
MAEARRAAVHFLGPPSRVRLACVDAEVLSTAQSVHWAQAPGGAAPVSPPTLRRGRDAAHTHLRLDPTTPPGEHTVLLQLADGSQREVTVSVEPRPRVRVAPSELRFDGAPGSAVSARLLVENRGNVDIAIGDTLVTGVFDDDGIETALASTYRMDSDDLGKIVGNVFARLREAHGGLLRLRVAEGAGAVPPGDRRVLVLETTLSSKLRRGHGYHGVLEIGGHGISVHLQIAGGKSEHEDQGAA